MAHWKGHSERHLKAAEESQAKRDEYRYEMSLTKWFKRRRSAIYYAKKNALYYIAGVMFMRGVEPLAFNISVIDLLYQHAFIGNMVLITISLALGALNWIFNKELRK